MRDYMGGKILLLTGNVGEKNTKKIGEIEEEKNGENLGWKMKLAI